MSYLRNPRTLYLWESDGDVPWMKFKAADGTFHDSSNEADRHDKELGQWPWEAAAAQPGDTAAGGERSYEYRQQSLPQLRLGGEDRSRKSLTRP